MSNLPLEAWQELYPQKEFPYDVSLYYSAKFRDYNAIIRKQKMNIEFGLSRSWEGVSDPIIIGLLQTLYARLLREKKKTMQMELYHDFIKNLHLAIPKIASPPELEESFLRVSERYLNHTLEMPTLRWGPPSKSRLGLYDFHTDTITLTSLLKGKPTRLLDYVMYHEMLHKKLKFSSHTTRSTFHSKAFREAEHQFENWQECEQELKSIGRKRHFLFDLF